MHYSLFSPSPLYLHQLRWFYPSLHCPYSYMSSIQGPPSQKNNLKSRTYFLSFLNISNYLHSLYSTESLPKVKTVSSDQTDFYQLSFTLTLVVCDIVGHFLLTEILSGLPRNYLNSGSLQGSLNHSCICGSFATHVKDLVWSLNHSLKRLFKEILYLLVNKIKHIQV